MSIKGIDIKELRPETVADRFYQDGEGQDSNPYPQHSLERERFALRMGHHHQQELIALRQQERAGV